MGIIQNTQKNDVFVSVNKDSGQLSITDSNRNIIEINGIEGKLKKIERVTGEYKNSDLKFDKLVFTIEDDENYKVQLGFDSSPAKSIINSLLSAEKLYNQNIELRLYKKTDKDKFISTYLRVNDKKLSWTYDKNDVPVVETVKLKTGKTVEDDTARKEFFEKKYNTLKDKFNSEIGTNHTEAKNEIENTDEPF